MPDPAETADVIIVGGGSAGAVLAARLSQDPARTVLLLEAGHAYAPDAYPPGLLDADKIADPDHDWGYTSRGTSQMPPIPTPRGKVLGGSSAVNAAVALRARAADFVKWGAHGVEGWSFDDVLPAFKLLENTPVGDDAYHGRTGPLSIRQRTDGELTPSLRGLVEAAVADGFKRVHDFNGAEQNGADGYPVDVVDGIRQNTGLVYLTADVRRRPSLTIRGDVNVDRVLFDGTTAVGVLAADGTAYRGREVILSGGTYGSPAILLRSGVGPADELTALGIEVVADLPVGQRLQDQPGYVNAYALAPGYLEMTPAVGSLLWTASREAAADELDLHVTATHLMPGSLSPTGGAIVLMAALTQPESTGTLKLASRDPGAAPLIDANYLGTGRDARRMLEGVKIGRAIARNPVFAPFVAAELAPGDAVADDDTLARNIAANLAVYGHPTSTAPMGGPADPWAVVDSVGAVNGLRGLRVADASIIPEVPSSTTNVTVIMLAERIYQRVYAS
ncbi:MAG TPA: GMC family oxidoreductase N-terminal domain-containing protein [Streptosporangiaceae bacterium]